MGSSDVDSFCKGPGMAFSAGFMDSSGALDPQTHEILQSRQLNFKNDCKMAASGKNRNINKKHRAPEMLEAMRQRAYCFVFAVGIPP